MSDHGIPRSTILKVWPERYPGEADDFQQAWAGFKAAWGDAADPRDFARFCAQSKQGSPARRWYDKRRKHDRPSV